MDTETHGQAHLGVLLQVCIAGLHGRDDAQPGADRALGVIFVRLGITEINQQAIAEILGDVAVKTLDHLRARGLVGAHDLPQVFGVELGREGRGAHQITEHDRELAPFGVWW